MVFQNDILAGASGATVGYTIDQSIRFNSADSSYLSRTPSSNPTGGDASGAKQFTVSVWLKRGKLSVAQAVFAADASVSSAMAVQLAGASGSTLADQIDFDQESGGSPRDRMIPSALYRDVSAWYHLCLMVDTTQATAANRLKIAINGVLVSNWYTNDPPALNAYFQWNKNGVLQRIGSNSHNVGNLFDGYMAEFHNVDGVAAETSFGEFNNSGVWVPKAYEGAYGNNGFYITGENSAALGTDYSGNGNDFTSSGLTTDDQVPDTPTDNYAVFNNIIKGKNSYHAGSYGWGSNTISEGGLKVLGPTGANLAGATISYPSSGKFYYEATYIGTDSAFFGIADLYDDTKAVWYRNNGWVSENSSSWNTSSGAASYTAGDVLAISVNMDGNEAKFYKNNSLQSTVSLTAGSTYTPVLFGGNSSIGFSVDFGQLGYTYTPPTGFSALSTANLPTPEIKDGSKYFDIALYTGTSAVQSITDVNFSPDKVWIKNRSGVANHGVFDTVRGATKAVFPSLSNAELTFADSLTSFDSAGFTLGADTGTGTGFNGTANTYVAWMFKELAGFFDIVSYTADGLAGRTVAHSLGVAPELVLVKDLDVFNSWGVYHKDSGAGNILFLDSSSAATASATAWSATVPDTSNFTIGANGTTNNSGDDYIAYLFSSKTGLCKVGSYTGNGNVNGPMINCGGRPRFLIIKRNNGLGNWFMYDRDRQPYNENYAWLRADSSAVESAAGSQGLDILSSGFKLRAANTDVNASGGTYIYIAIFDAAFGGVGVAPATAL